MHAPRLGRMSSLAAPTFPGMSEREVNNAWAEWLAQRMRAVGLPNPTDLARAAGGQPDQSVVSRWLNEGRTPTIDALRRVEKPLRTPLLELLVRAGHITAAEARMPARFEKPNSEDSLDLTLLSEDTRQHIRNQYEFLRRVQPERPSRPLRAVARPKPKPKRGDS